MAADLRGRAERLQGIADELNRSADALDAAAIGSDRKMLRGRDLLDELLKHVEVGQELHYRDAERLLHAAGFTAGGVDPSATLLAQLTRAPEFKRGRRRSGRYKRIEVSDAT
jgi:hypothetical protein